MKPRITVGIVCTHMTGGTILTIQSHRLNNLDIRDQLEIIVADCDPQHPEAVTFRDAVARLDNVRYIAVDKSGSASQPQDRIFSEATGEIVLCIDSGARLEPDALPKLLNWLSCHPESDDLILGTRVHGNLSAASNEADAVQPGNKLGTETIACCDECVELESPEVETPDWQLLCCRKAAWLGIHLPFQEPAEEAGYIREKFELAGRRTLRAPFLKWRQRVPEPNAPAGQRSPCNPIRNRLLAALELNRPLTPIMQSIPQEIPHEVLTESWNSAVSTLLVRRGTTEFLEHALQEAVRTKSDINEHLGTLSVLASQCDHVTEFGVRTGVSTRALLAGRPIKMISFDLTPFGDFQLLTQYASTTTFAFRQENTLHCDIEATELLFIDTLHTYKQLAAELERHAGKVSKYLVFHDTEIFGTVGEDDGPGLNLAIAEFLQNNPHWMRILVFQNNSGLTVLGKKPLAT
ncbi:MAG: hypothetical protein V4719_10845 [Planctomycetota bacterium]